jgi:hypothetical protein
MKISQSLLVALIAIILASVLGCDGGDGAAVSVGDYATVSEKMWCMSSVEALGEVQNWAARNDYEEMSKVYDRKGVTTLEAGDRVKVLDLKFGGDARIRTARDQECWTVSNVLHRR